MSYEEMYEIAAKNVVDKDWAVAQRLIDELKYPFVDSRENRVHIQLKTICFILKMFEEDKKVVLLDAAVGTGKSLINVTTALNTIGGTFLCTPQKSLQAQYIREFPELVTEIKGRNNYRCNKNMGVCSEGACRQLGKYKCDNSTSCEYWRQKTEAIAADICVSNFSYFCLEGGRAFGNRELLIIDEGDDIAESAVLGMCTVKFSHWTLWGLHDQVDWKHDDMTILDDVKALLSTEVDNLEDRDVYTMQEMKRLDGYRDLLSRTHRVDDTWVTQRDKQLVKGRHGKKAGGVYESIEFKPLSIAPFADGLLWKRSEKVVISSATILDRKSYITETGLDCYDEDDIAYVKMDSMFPVKNRRIYDLGRRVGKLTAKEMSANIGKATDTIIEIANKHRGERGLIHTTSFRNVDTLFNMLSTSEISDRMIYHNSGLDRNILIDRMMSGDLAEDAIVVSPSMTRGADLKGDLCRFGILMKVPYGNTLDARIKVRSKDFRWYSMQALREVCQSYGRGTRAQDDFCTLYVLDAGFKKLINGVVKRNVPPWFRDAIVWDANI